MRKEAGFEVTDIIRITFKGGERICSIAERYAEAISHDTLARSFENAEPTGYTKAWNINGEEVELGVRRED